MTFVLAAVVLVGALCVAAAIAGATTAAPPNDAGSVSGLTRIAPGRRRGPGRRGIALSA